MPAGFSLQADKVGDTGPSDLAKAIKDDGDPSASSALRAERFVRGYQQLWIGPADAEIIEFVYQFADATGARQAFARDKPGLHSEAPPGATTFSVAGLPVPYADAIEGSAKGTSAAVVLFTTGVFNVQVICNGPTLADLRTRASTIALDQYNHLR